MRKGVAHGKKQTRHGAEFFGPEPLGEGLECRNIDPAHAKADEGTADSGKTDGGGQTEKNASQGGDEGP